MRAMRNGLRHGLKILWSLARSAFGDRVLHRPVEIRKYGGFTERPPPMHWVPCHPSTIRRFKATMACPEGHVLTLRIHTITPDGTVAPSVVCPGRGCSFHAYVRLVDWTFGFVR